MAAANVPKLYYGVIEEVIANVREAFIDEGIDEQVLLELKQIWQKKLAESKAIDREPESPIVSRVISQSMPSQQTIQQQTTNMGSSASITHHMAMPSNLVSPTLVQYSTGSGDQKPILNIPQKLTLTVPAHIAQAGLQTLVSAAPGGTAVQLPAEFASLFQSGQQISGVQYQTLTADQLQKQFTVTIPVTAQQQQATRIMGQIDGADDTSDDDDDDDFQDNDDDRDENDDEQNEDDAGEEDEEPLNSDDDVSDDDVSDLFDTENVVVCQYDKITRSKNRWKFHLKDGIMNLQGKDFVFQKALGDSEW